MTQGGNENHKTLCRRESWKKDLLAVLILLLAGALLLVCLHLVVGKDIFGPSYYNTYTRQAMAWREGSLHLSEDVPALELAVYGNEYYVSFPPVPSLIEYPLTFFFGMETPDNLLMMVYSLIMLACFYLFLRKKELTLMSSALYAYMLCYGGCILPLLMEGAVWYHAQVLAMTFIAAALLCFSCDHPTPACIFFALSVGCRPFDVIYGPVMIVLYVLRRKGEGKTLQKVCLNLLPGIVCGLLIAAGYGAYNYFRFGDPLEFGHNYLPEFSTQGGIQFSLSHVATNAKTFIAGLPFSADGNALILKQFGFSFLIANPVLTIMLVLGVTDLIKKKFDWRRLAVICAFLLHLFLLLLHRTFGGYQFGARYTCDLLPYAALFLALRGKKITGA